MRHEVENQCREKYEFDKKQSSILRDISKIAKKVRETQYNSLFTYDYIEQNSADWQAHLQRISDYLILGKNIWWKMTEFGIEFFDVDNAPKKIELKPKVHHFRSSNMKTAANELEKNRSSIVDQNICILIHKIMIGNEQEKMYTKFVCGKIEIENFAPLDILSTDNYWKMI